MDNSTIIILLWLLCFIYATPALFICLDLRSGLRKAKIRGERIHSHKLQRTFQKVQRYYGGIMPLTVIDGLQLSAIWFMNTYYGTEIPMFFWCTFLGAVGVGCIETKSIYEPANTKEKQEMAEAKEIALAVAKAMTEHANDPKQIAAEIIQSLKDKEKQNG